MKRKIGFVAFLCVATAVSSSFATTYLYTPTSGSGDLWSVGTDWSAVPVSGSATTLVFSNSSTVLANGLTNASTNDISDLFQLNVLTLSGIGPASGAATIDINSASPSTGLEFVSNGATSPVINLSAAKGTAGLTYNVNVPMTLTNNTTMGVNSTSQATFNITGNVGGAGNLTISGTNVGGIVTLSGNNSYAGTTSVVKGSLVVANNNALGSTAGSTIVTEYTGSAAGGEIRLANGVTVTGETLTVAGYGSSSYGALATAANASATWAGMLRLSGSNARLGIQSSGTLTVSGPIVDDTTSSRLVIMANGGAVVIAGNNNTYSGNTDMLRGTLKIGADNALPTTTTLDVHQATADIATTFDLNGYNQTVAVLKRTITSVGATVTNSSSTLSTFSVGSDTTDSTYSGVIAGKLALTKVGSSTLTLSGVNTYSGITTINAGTLSVSGGVAIYDTSGVTLANTAGATLNLASNEAIGYLSGGGEIGGNVLLNANTLTVSGTTSTTFAGAISGTGGLTKGYSSTLTLSGNNTYSGLTSVANGYLVVASNTALGSTAGATTMASCMGSVRLATASRSPVKPSPSTATVLTPSVALRPSVMHRPLGPER